MTKRIVDISLRKAAIVAGFGLLTMTIFAIYAYFFVRPSLIVLGDVTTTANNRLVVKQIRYRYATTVFRHSPQNAR